MIFAMVNNLIWQCESGRYYASDVGDSGQILSSEASGYSYFLCSKAICKMFYIFLLSWIMINATYVCEMKIRTNSPLFFPPSHNEFI